MKKITGIGMFIAALTAIIGITACLQNEDEDDRYEAPTVYLSTINVESFQSYNISFAPIENMEYANVFRISDGATVNIGQVIPNDTKNLPNAFVFEDVYTMTGQAYKYFVRFYNGAYYSYTKESSEVDGIGQVEATLSPDDSISMLYVCNHSESEEEYTLRLDGTDVTLPAGFSELRAVIGISKTEKEKPFLVKTVPATTSSSTSYTVSASDLTPVDLQKILPPEFLDVNLTLPSLIGVNTVGKDDTYIKNKTYTNYYWTQPRTVVLKTCEIDASGEPIVGSRNTTDGSIIYEGSETETIKVPSIIAPDNPFDYTGDTRAAQPSALSFADDVFLDVSPYNPVNR